MESTVYEMPTAKNITNDDCLLDISVYASAENGLSSNLCINYFT